MARGLRRALGVTGPEGARRGIQRVRRPNGSAARGAPLPAQDDEERADGADDRRLRDDRGQRARGLRPRCSRTSGFDRGPADLIAASVMSAPAAFVFAKMFVPETDTPVLDHDRRTRSSTARAVGVNSLWTRWQGGVTAGLKLAVNVVAMLAVFLRVDWRCSTRFGQLVRRATSSGAKASTFHHDLRAPLRVRSRFLMGVPMGRVREGRSNCSARKTMFNEFIAYDQPDQDGSRTARSASARRCCPRTRCAASPT